MLDKFFLFLDIKSVIAMVEEKVDVVSFSTLVKVKLTLSFKEILLRLFKKSFIDSIELSFKVTKTSPFRIFPLAEMVSERTIPFEIELYKCS